MGSAASPRSLSDVPFTVGSGIPAAGSVPGSDDSNNSNAINQDQGTGPARNEFGQATTPILPGGGGGGGFKLNHDNIIISGEATVQEQLPTNTNTASAQFSNRAAVLYPLSFNLTQGDQDLQHLTLLVSRCEMTVRFFEGFGNQPTKAELSSLMFETDRFFSDLLMTDESTKEGFVGFTATAIEDIYRGDVTPDTFRVDFDFNVQVFVEDAVHFDVVTLDDVHAVIDGASFPTFITDYIWMAPPLTRNQFAETHGVDMKCYDNEVV